MTSRGRLLVQKALTECEISTGDYVVNKDGSLSLTSSSCDTRINSRPTSTNVNSNVVNTTSNNVNINSNKINQEQSVYKDTRSVTQNLEMKKYHLNEDNVIIVEERAVINEAAQFLGDAVNIFEENVSSLNIEAMNFEEEDEYNRDDNNTTLYEDNVNIVEDVINPCEDAANLNEDDMSLEENLFNNDEAAIILNEDALNSVEETINNYEDTVIPYEDALNLDGRIVVQEQNSNTNEEPRKTTRKKRHQVSPKTWKINEWKTARKHGKAYKGKKKSEDGKWKYDVEKKAKEMKPRCKCKNKENGKVQCVKLTEEDRKKNFDEYWKLDWEAKKVYIKFLTKKIPTARERDRKENAKSRRKWSNQYYLKKQKLIVRVCKTMFLNTLSIGEWTALNWPNEEHNSGTEEAEVNSENLNSEESDFESNVGPVRKKLRKAREMEMLETFFSSLPKVESHYCRKNSSKMYIEPNWNSKRELYLFYVNDWCSKNDVNALSRCKFSQTFDDLNLSLFQPKKDLCDTCESFKSGNLESTVYEAHILRKEEARMEKSTDKADPKCLIYTMDLQALLLSPKSTVSSLYYKMKLSVHNLTFFDLKTTNAFCFLWNETEGCLTSNDFASITSHFVLSQLPLPDGKEKIVLFSDGCSYQNRSCNVANALLHISSTKKVIIEQKYLEVGHTQMEADAVHSTIEKKLKNKKINVPADYITVCQDARRSKPYSVEYLDHHFFKYFDGSLFYKSIRPGRGVGSPRVVDVRAFRYLPEGKIQFKLNFADEWEDLPQRKDKNIRPMLFEDLPSLYKERIKIKKRKFNDLQELKTVLERDYHEFYDNIPYLPQ